MNFSMKASQKRTDNMKRHTVGALVAIIVLLQPAAAAAQNVLNPDLSSYVSVEGLYTRALGNLSPTFPSATGGYVTYGHYFPEHLVAVLKVGYSNYDVSDTAPPDQKLQAVHVLAGPRYYFTAEGFMPFVFLHVGLNFVTNKIDVPDFSSDRTSTQFAWQFGFGGALRIAGPLMLEAQAKYNSHFLYHEGSTEGLEGLGNMTGFEYGVGLAWGFR